MLNTYVLRKIIARRSKNVAGSCYHIAPVAYQVILGPGIGQFREFESPRVHTPIYSWGLFLVHKFILRKARGRELATLDEKSTSSGIAEPYVCAIKIEGKNRGEERDDACDHGLSKSWKVNVCE